MWTQKRSLKTSQKIYAHINSRERKKQGKQAACVPQITDILVPQGVGGTPGYEKAVIVIWSKYIL